MKCNYHSDTSFYHYQIQSLANSLGTIHCYINQQLEVVVCSVVKLGFILYSSNMFAYMKGKNINETIQYIQLKYIKYNNTHCNYSDKIHFLTV